MKNFYLTPILFVLLFTMGCTQNALEESIQHQPGWRLTEIQVGDTTHTMKHNTVFSLYGQKLSGSFAVNGFGGEMYVAADGQVSFGEVMITSMAGEPSAMEEESLASKYFLATNHVEKKQDLLVFSDKKNSIQVTFAPDDLSYMKNLYANSWKFQGYLNVDKNVAVMHASEKEHHKGMQGKEFTATLKVSDQFTFDKKVNSLVYSFSGKMVANSFTGEIIIPKSGNRGMAIRNISTTKTKASEDVLEKERDFIELLSRFTNFSFAHNNLYIDNSEYRQIVMKAEK